MYHAALATFGKKSSKSHDWFKAKSTVMTFVIEAKRAALAEYKPYPVRGTYRFSGLPGARLSRLLGAAQTNTGQNSARTSRPPP